MSLRNCLGWILVVIGLFSSEAGAGRIDVRSTFEPMERRLHAAYGWDRGRRSAKPAASPQEGTTRTFWAYERTSDSDGQFYEVEATCQGVGTHAVIFVEDAQWNDRVVSEDVEGLISAFDQATPGHPDQGIYERTTWAFGEPPDVDGDPKIYMLLLDIKDFLEEEGAYVAGYFSGVNEYTDEEVQPYGYRSNETEMFYLDVNPGKVSSVDARRTLAHEFQHMIHFNQDPGEETWINEGCSTFAEWVSGYEMRLPVHFKDDPSNSLTDWGGRLADYEQVGMFVAYLYEHWGGATTIRALVAQSWNGTEGVTKTLKEQGSGVAFDEVFRDWVIANYLDDEGVGDGRYAYSLYDLSGPYQFGATKTYELYPVDTMEEKVWYSATSYLRFTGGKKLRIAFNGTDQNDFTVQLIALRDGVDTRVEMMTLNALNDGSWDAEDADEVILVPTIGPGVGVEASYRYSAVEIEDSVQPGIVSVTPLAGSFDVSLDATVSVVFAAVYDPSTVQINFGHYPGGVWTQSADGRELTIALTGHLDPNTTYTLTVKAGVNDSEGQALTTDDYTWSFTTWAGIVEEEETYLTYDEGSYNYQLYWEHEGEASGVRFTPPYLPAQLLSACFYLSDLSLGSRFLVRIVQDDGTGLPGKELTDPLEVEAHATGWLTVDLTERAVRVDGDFHVLFETVTMHSGEGVERLCQPRFGAEDFAPLSGRSWDRYFSGDPPALRYEKVDGFDYGIRAVVIPAPPAAVVEETGHAPEVFELRQNFPNPFNANTVISFTLQRTSHINIAIYNLLGQLVRELTDRKVAPGVYRVQWDGKDSANIPVSSGIYLYRMATDAGVITKKMILLR